jgi:hypothetical protein
MGVGGMWMPQTQLHLWAMIIRYHAYRATHPTTTHHHNPHLFQALSRSRKNTTHTQRIHSTHD